MLSFVLALAAAAPSSAPTLPASAKADMQCVAVFAAVVGTANGDKQTEFASLGALYFLGRVDTAQPGIDLGAALTLEVPAVEKDGDAIMGRCSAEFAKVGKRLIDAGKAVTAAADRPQ